MKKIFFIAFSFLLVSFVAVKAFAAATSDPAPMVMLKNTSDKMLSELAKHRGHLKNNDALIYGIVSRVLIPHFDLATMSRGVVGKSYWQNASADLQKKFIGEFTRYVIRTYAAPLSSYDGEKIKFYPIRDYDATQNYVQVNSDLLRNSGPSVAMSYRVEKQGGTWLVYDFSVEGVSLVQNYRGQFAQTLQSGGLAKLVQELHASNSK